MFLDALFLFTCSLFRHFYCGMSRCVVSHSAHSVTDGRTYRQTDRQTARKHYHANIRSYCVLKVLTYRLNSANVSCLLNGFHVVNDCLRSCVYRKGQTPSRHSRAMGWGFRSSSLNDFITVRDVVRRWRAVVVHADCWTILGRIQPRGTKIGLFGRKVADDRGSGSTIYRGAGLTAHDTDTSDSRRSCEENCRLPIILTSSSSSLFSVYSFSKWWSILIFKNISLLSLRIFITRYNVFTYWITRSGARSLYQTKINDVHELREHIVDEWVKLDQRIIHNHWRVAKETSSLL